MLAGTRGRRPANAAVAETQEFEKVLAEMATFLSKPYGNRSGSGMHVHVSLVDETGANAFRRFQAESHASTRASWGYDNRTAALRIPDSDRANTRIEHRVPGADANPYLVIAAVLAGIRRGLADGTAPDRPATGNSYRSATPGLPTTRSETLAAFEGSDFIEAAFGADYRMLCSACKPQETAILNRRVTDLEYDTSPHAL